jgi:CRISPR/Cas system-associated protein Cas10 (large subunit of type III CRISPR-Cas system)
MKLFVGGDLSGIQNFLYNISSKKAALSLRGRSWYLDDYMKGVYKELSKQMTSKTSMKDIYNSGGKFYFITENNPENRSTINKIAKEKNQELWDEHFGLLSINIAYVPFEETEDKVKVFDPEETDKIGILFRRITQEFAKQKQHKFKDVILDNYDKIFSAQQVSDKTEVCDVTGIESDELCGIEGLWVLPSVKEQIEKGREIKGEEKIRSDFADYCEGSYLGVLRMDVDGLGTRFAKGFNNWTEYTAFSTALQDFFSKTIKGFVDKQYVEIIYAGGDDVFAVGKWDKLIDFAYRVHTELETKFNKEGIHISAGLVIVNPKFPIAKAAKISGDAEEMSKQYIKDKDKEDTKQKPTKNAITFFNETISWQEEFEKVREDKDCLLDLVNNHGMSKGLLHKIMYYYGMQKESEKDKQQMSYIWHSAYYLTRFMDKYKKDQPKVYDFCKQVRDTRITKAKELKLLAIACRWAELILKETDKENKENKINN